MQNDAISRSAVLEFLDSVRTLKLNNQQIYSAALIGELSKGVEKLPALDVEPVIHAKWIEDGYYEKPCVCSHCGEEAFYLSTFHEQFEYDWDENLVPCGYEENREYVHSKRCHNCGAIMDYEEDEEDAAD